MHIHLQSQPDAQSHPLYKGAYLQYSSCSRQRELETRRTPLLDYSLDCFTVTVPEENLYILGDACETAASHAGPELSGFCQVL
jgi:hypothetical protein